MGRNKLSSASSLFDAAINGDRDEELAEQGLEVLARPGALAPARIAGDTLVLRRARAEGRLTTLAAARRMARGRASMESLGVACEGFGEGVFVEVDEGPGRRAWRI